MKGQITTLKACRGSTGFGKVHLHKGDKEWGVGAMQHDLSDVVEWAIQQGLTHPSKVAIIVRRPPLSLYCRRFSVLRPLLNPPLALLCVGARSLIPWRPTLYCQGVLPASRSALVGCLLRVCAACENCRECTADCL